MNIADRVKRLMMIGDKNTIYGRVLHGYTSISHISLGLILFTIVLLLLVRSGYNDAMDNQRQQIQTQQFITEHYKWLNELNRTLQTGEPFSGSIDPKTCALGEWIDSAAPHKLKDAQMDAALAEISKPHKELHASVAELIELSKTDRTAAQKKYAEEVVSNVAKIAHFLQIIGSRCLEMAERQLFYMTIFVFSMILIYVLIAWYVVKQGPRIARTISDPLVGVAAWAKSLAENINNSKFDTKSLNSLDHTVEIDTMVHALTVLTDDIRDHANILKKIAEGDLTQYIPIKSDDDILGKSLYHLVQNNDIMFSELLKIADMVAMNATVIAESNEQLAAAAGDAAISENAMIAIQEVNNSAEVIKELMQHLNLRQREEGKPYIPPEKAHDEEFIREAVDNYQKAMENSNN